MVRAHLPGESVFRAILPEDIDWKPFPAFPASARLAVVVGEPSKPGPYLIRVKAASGTKLMPHRHPEDRIYAVMSGVFHIVDGIIAPEPLRDDTNWGGAPFRCRRAVRTHIPLYNRAVVVHNIFVIKNADRLGAPRFGNVKTLGEGVKKPRFIAICKSEISRWRQGQYPIGSSFVDSRIAALDGLRAIAVLMVILTHANYWFSGVFAHGLIDGPLASILGGGWIGVDLFFVLSGFLITRILEVSKDKLFYLRDFYARRALRIMPLLNAYVIAILVLSWLGVRLVSDGDAISVLAYYYNFRVALTEAPGPFVHPFWSLAIEEHFYLLWPFAVLALSRTSLMRLCLVGMAFCFILRVIVLMSGAWVEVAYFITPCRLDGLMGGSFVALALADPVWRERFRRYCGPIAIGCAGILLGLLLGQRHFLDFVDFRRMPDAGVAVDSTMVLTVGISTAAVLFAAIVVLIVLGRSESNAARIEWLKHPWLVAIGKYSYGMYVLHTLIMTIIIHRTIRYFPLIENLPGYIGKTCLGLFVIALSFGAAYLSYHCFEKQFLSMKKYFNDDRRPYVATRAMG